MYAEKYTDFLSKDGFIWEYKVYKSVVSPWATSAVVNHNPHVLIHLFKNPLSTIHMASLYYLLFCAFVFITDEYRLRVFIEMQSKQLIFGWDYKSIRN